MGLVAIASSGEAGKQGPAQNKMSTNKTLLPSLLVRMILLCPTRGPKWRQPPYMNLGTALSNLPSYTLFPC